MLFVRKSKRHIQIMAPYELLPYQLDENDEVIYLVLKSSAWTFKRAWTGYVTFLLQGIMPFVIKVKMYI